jgi:hypothetical protein
MKLEKYFTQFPGAHLLFNLQIKLINALQFLLTSLINGTLTLGLLFQYLNLINRLLQEIISTLHEEMKKRLNYVALAQQEALNALRERFKSENDASKKTPFLATVLHYFEKQATMRIIAKIAEALIAWMKTGLADVFESKMQHLFNMLGFTISRSKEDMNTVILTAKYDPSLQIRLRMTPNGMKIEALDPKVRSSKLFQYLERARKIVIDFQIVRVLDAFSGKRFFQVDEHAQ